jgi:RNA polymerase sigma-70 factor (ECF subfamily)
MASTERPDHPEAGEVRTQGDQLPTRFADSPGRDRDVPEIHPEADLVARAVAGDRDAFTALVRRHDPRMRALAYKLLGGDRHAMDDVLQDAYLRAYLAMPRFRHDAEPGSWLYRIVYNACIDELRRARLRPAPVDPGDRDWERGGTQADPGVVVGNRDLTVRALRALPEEQRVTLVLVDGEGFDNVTAARILDVPPGTVGSRLSRARATVRSIIEEVER